MHKQIRYDILTFYKTDPYGIRYTEGNPYPLILGCKRVYTIRSGYNRVYTDVDVRFSKSFLLFGQKKEWNK